MPDQGGEPLRLDSGATRTPLTEPAASRPRGTGAKGCVSVLGGITLAMFALAATRCDSTLAMVDNVVLLLDTPEWGAGMDTADHMLDYLVAYPDDVSIVVATLSDSGVLQADGEEAVLHNADEPMPLATTVRLIHLAAWARAAEDGRLNAEGPVPAERWSSWHLPRSDGGAHAAALEDLGLSDPPAAAAAVPWSAIVRAMIRHTDTAALALIRDELGDPALSAVIRDGGLTTHDPVGSLLGRLLLGSNHEVPTGDPDQLQALGSQPLQARTLIAADLLDRWRDPAWQDAERHWREHDAPVGRLRRQAMMAELFPRASAGDYARMLAGISSDRFLSPAVAARMREHLQWPMAVGDNAKRLASYASTGGALPGVVVHAMYLTPRQGDFAGETRVVVLMMRRMPMSAWLRLRDTSGHRFFALKVAQRRAFAAKVGARLEASLRADRTRR